MITGEATLEFMVLLFGEWTREPEGTAALPDPRVATGRSLSTHLSVVAHSVEAPATPQRKRRACVREALLIRVADRHSVRPALLR